MSKKVMQESNKLVLKVKFQDLNDKVKKTSEPDMVTEWYMGRIFVACAILLMLLGGFLHWLNEDSIPPVEKPLLETKSIEAIDAVAPKQKIAALEPITQSPLPNIKKSPELNTVKPVSNIKAKQVNKVKKQTVELTNIKIVRALLTTGVNNKEPTDNITLPIKVNNNKASRVYYFTEIVDMKGQFLYHQWLKDSQLIYKRKINILGNRWRASTSKLITYSGGGNWAVRLVNRKGEVLNEIQFEVIQE